MKNGRLFIFGLGRSGFSFARFLKERGETFFAWDDTPAVRARFIQKIGEDLLKDFHTFAWEEGDTLVISPGISPKAPGLVQSLKRVYAQHVRIVCDIEPFLERISGTMLGVTGTNGKSTTTALIAHVLGTSQKKVFSGGNIGIPVFDLPQADTYVLELSSYQLELTFTKKLSHVALLNITPDHLERHGSIANYVKAKERILSLMCEGGSFIVGIDTPPSAALYERYRKKLSVIPVSTEQTLSKGIFWRDGFLTDTYFDEKEHAYDFHGLRYLRGIHNAQNIMVAYAMGRLMGLHPADICNKIMSFPGLVHRQEFCGEFGKTVFINDSKATNVDSTLKALTVFDNIWLFLGGLLKDGDPLDPIMPYLPKIKRLYTFGAGKDKVTSFFGAHLPIHVYPTLGEALEGLKEDLKKHSEVKTVLLSPASASFDEFTNFEQRGDFFKKFVQDNILRSKVSS